MEVIRKDRIRLLSSPV